MEMENEMTYVAAELEPVMAYPDQNGKLHLSREEAIEANFQDDFRNAIITYCEAHNQAIPPIGAVHLVKHMAEYFPDYLRILVGDRDKT